jgi:hypothetical protein
VISFMGTVNTVPPTFRQTNARSGIVSVDSAEVSCLWTERRLSARLASGRLGSRFACQGTNQCCGRVARWQYPPSTVCQREPCMIPSLQVICIASARPAGQGSATLDE